MHSWKYFQKCSDANWIIIISSKDWVQNHVSELWRLLEALYEHLKMRSVTVLLSQSKFLPCQENPLLYFYFTIHLQYMIFSTLRNSCIGADNHFFHKKGIKKRLDNLSGYEKCSHWVIDLIFIFSFGNEVNRCSKPSKTLFGEIQHVFFKHSLLPLMNPYAFRLIKTKILVVHRKKLNS